jgi:hypothetical protein
LIRYGRPNLGKVQTRSPRLSLNSKMASASKNNFFLCALCVLCGQSRFPLA